jgi:hypothetical protein
MGCTIEFHLNLLSKRLKKIENKLNYKAGQHLRGGTEMYEKIMRTTVTAGCGLFLICLLSASPAFAETEQRSVKSFDGVYASGPVKVFLTEGNREAVTVTVERIELDKIVTDVVGNKLEVKPKTGAFTSGNPDIRVQVTYTKLRELHSASGAQLFSESTLTGDKIEVNASTGGGGELRFDVTTLASTVISGSELTVSGRAQNHEITVNTGGKLSAFDLRCENAFVKIGSGGFAEVFASELIEGTVKSAGGLRYKGDPKKERIDTSGGGKARPAD